MVWPERPRVTVPPGGLSRKNAFSRNSGLGDVSFASKAAPFSSNGATSRVVRQWKARMEACGVGRRRRRNRNRMSYRLVAAAVVGGVLGGGGGGLLAVEAASAGAAHSCAVLDDFTVKVRTRAH